MKKKHTVIELEKAAQEIINSEKFSHCPYRPGCIHFAASYTPLNKLIDRCAEALEICLAYCDKARAALERKNK